MAKYALGTRPLINSLAEETEEDELMQVWFADDSTSGGSIEGVKKWWDHLKETGPKYGYYPKPSKTHIIVKDMADLDEVKTIFGGEGIKITTQGQRHIGAALGSDAFKEEFVKIKVDKWVKDVEELAIIAEDEPQSVLSAFNIAVVHRWTYLQRTVEGISDYFEPLEDALRNKLIPALVGRQVSDDERIMLGLPYRFGGLGIQNPVETADHEYKTSVAVTKNLTQLIIAQDMDVNKVNAVQSHETKIKRRAEKELRVKRQADELKERMNVSQRRYFEGAQEKGASSWLSSLPIKKLGYVLNKQEFRDAVCLRYGWEVKGIPKICACGKQNSTDHSLVCKLGGFVIMRHDAVRDVEASLMREVCKDVQVEQLLLPANAAELNHRAISGPGARMDVVARDIWSGGEKNYCDVNVTHANAESNIGKSMTQIYREHENGKKNDYNERVLNVEKGTFTPLVFTTSGGMAPECLKLNKRLAELISNKKNETYSKVMMHVRTRLRFALLKGTLIGLRGFRGKRLMRQDEDAVGDIDYNLIPQQRCYETT